MHNISYVGRQLAYQQMSLPFLLLSLRFSGWARDCMVWNTHTKGVILVSLCWLYGLYLLSGFFFAYPQPTHCWDRVGKRKSFGAVKVPLTSSQNTDVLSTLFESEIQRTAPHGLLWRKLTPSQPDPIQLDSNGLCTCTWLRFLILK